MDSSSDYFKPLTGVRAMAAFMVYFCHWNQLSEAEYSPKIINFINELHVGVTIFFVLSGFLITNRYFFKEKIDLKKYFINRIARIYPIYFIISTIIFVWSFLNNLYGMKEGLAVYLLNISFLKGFFHNYKFTGIAQGWSLTVEELFYIMAPMFFLFIKKNKIWLLYFPVILICVGSFLVIISSKGHFFGYPTHGFFISYDFMFNYTFFGRCIEFFIGIALALAFKEGWIKTDFKFFTYFGFIGIIFSVFLISSFKGNFDLGISHPAGKLVNNLVLPLIGIAPFFLGLLREKTIISSILGSPVFVLLGKSSYIFYLIHYGLFAYFLRDHISSNLVVFLVMNLISVVFYIALEEPMNKWIRRKFSSGSPGKSES